MGLLGQDLNYYCNWGNDQNFVAVSLCNGILFGATEQLLSYGKCQDDIKTVQVFTKQINCLCWITSLRHLRACRGRAEGKSWRGEWSTQAQCLTRSWFRILPHMCLYFTVYLYISFLLALCFYLSFGKLLPKWSLLLFEMHVTFHTRVSCLFTQKHASLLISYKISQVSINVLKLLFQ